VYIAGIGLDAGVEGADVSATVTRVRNMYVVIDAEERLCHTLSS
jgi:hypothetical protein